jgi:IS30 family transposase
MNNYTQLTQEERYQIAALLKVEKSVKSIAECLGRCASTIHREIKRNRGKRGYCPKQAQCLAEKRKFSGVKRIKDEVWIWVIELIERDWSPEQISLWLKQKKVHVSHEWIYQFIFKDKRRGGKLYTFLRCKKKRKKRYGSYNTRGKIVNQVSICERPEIVDTRERIGDWEVDTVLGKRGHGLLVTLNERKSRFTWMVKVPNKTSGEVTKAVISSLKELEIPALTLTSDNGKEFAEHEKIAEKLNLDYYFADPYSSWQRGTNENSNGLIRQFFPKGQNFEKVSFEDIQFALDRLNNRPRKCLGMKTPNQVLFGINPVALGS